MPGIIVAPEVQKARMLIQGLFSLRSEDADLECNCPQRRGNGCGGIEIASIPLTFRAFELLCNENAKKFLRSMHARGREWTGSPILLHGPWPSRTSNLVDIDSPQWDGAMRRDKGDGAEHPERILGFVGNPADKHEWMDYVLLAQFEVNDIYTDLEAPVGHAVS